MQYFVEINEFDFRNNHTNLQICELWTGTPKKFAAIRLRNEPKYLRICELLKNLPCPPLRVPRMLWLFSWKKNIGRRGLKTTAESVKSSPKVGGKAAVTRSVEEAVPRSKVRPGTGGSSQGSASPPYAVVEKVQVGTVYWQSECLLTIGMVTFFKT